MSPFNTNDLPIFSNFSFKFFLFGVTPMRTKSYLPRNIHGKKCTKDTIKSIETDDFMKYNKKSLNEDDDEAMTIAIHCVLDAYDDIWNEDYLFETTE